MNSLLGLENATVRLDCLPIPSRHGPPKLVVELEPWGRAFLHNLADTFWRREAPLVTTSAPAPFWPDVFVSRRLPWGAFAESLVYHAVITAVVWGLTSLTVRHPQIAQPRAFDPADVIYYSPSEYLPPLDTGHSAHPEPLKGKPELAKQPILSVPPEADNRHQTIVTPPDVKLTHDVQTPNIVSWGNHTVPVPLAATERRPVPPPALPTQIVAPVPEVQRAERNLTSLSTAVVAPPPDANPGKTRAVASISVDVVAPVPEINAARRQTMSGGQPSVVEPPPTVNAASVHKLGDINIGYSEVVAPAPELAVSAQRALPSLSGSGKAVVPPPPALDAGRGVGSGASHSRAARSAGLSGQPGQQVVPPPPLLPGAKGSDSGGRLIALGLYPSVTPPATPPQGNRRGTFAATPEGRVGAPGTPDIRGDSNAGTNGHGLGNDRTKENGRGNGDGAPPGLHVGAPKQLATGGASDLSSAAGGSGSFGRASTIAAASPAPNPAAPPSPTPRRPRVELVDNPSPLEQQVFGGRRLYSMTLNMPNLNSAGGSWVIRFAELDGNAGTGELIAPAAERKVDPAYPLQLMQENVSGKVTLRAIIKSDGSVKDIRVLSGADHRLDQYAIEALARWHFLPATKNGANVDVEAIVIIPFKPILHRPF